MYKLTTKEATQTSETVELIHIVESHPILEMLLEQGKIKISSPCAKDWGKQKRVLKDKLQGITKDKLINTLHNISLHSNTFRLHEKQKLSYRIAGEIKNKYPDLISDILSYERIDRTNGKAIVIMQFHSLIIEQRFVEACIGKSLLQIAKESFGLNEAYLVLVAPCGADECATEYIRERLPEEQQGRVGVLTVKEVAESFGYNRGLPSLTAR